MQESKTLRLILNSDSFYIPTIFRSLHDVNQDIYNSLLKKNEYLVESKVSNIVFECFINNWVKNEPLNLNTDNISEYDLLSKEFDRIKAHIQLFNTFQFNKKLENNKFLKEELSKMRKKKNKINKHSQIIHLLFNQNGIQNYSNFLEIKRDLYKFCIRKKIDSIYYMVNKKVNYDGLPYLINVKEKTACLIATISAEGDIIVPRSITHNSEEFNITCIKKGQSNWHYVKSFTFSDDSELQIVGKKLFTYSFIEHIKFPSSLVQIDKKAFYNSKHLKTIEFSENSKLKVIGKAAFKNSGIIKIKIPSQVTRIEEETFYCENLKDIEFSDDSKLEYISPNSFCHSLIKRITIPPNVTKINSNTFSFCYCLHTVEFSKNSKLNSICRNAFCTALIKSLILPSSVETFENEWCNGMSKLDNFTIMNNNNNVKNIMNYNDTFIIGKSDLTKGNFDVLLFVRRDVEKVTIPSFIKRIAPYAFQYCYNLKTVDFEDDSQLEVIDEFAFHDTCIVKMSIPSNVTEFKDNWILKNSSLIDIDIIYNKEQNIMYYCNKFILGKTNKNKNEFDTLILARRDLEEVTIPFFIKRIESCAFQRCEKLKTIQFSDDSELNYIGNNAFGKTLIEKITIPSHVHTIEKFAFCECNNLVSFEFKDDSEIDKISQGLFEGTSIRTISIPSKVTSIEPCTFKRCYYIKNVTFSKDSKLQKICEKAFSDSSIEQISIPSSVRIIDDEAFSITRKLKNVEIKEDSKLKIIGRLSFHKSKINKIFIPAGVTDIKFSAFYECNELQKVEFSNKSELKIIEPYAFCSTSIESISIPSNVNKIGHNAFSYCDNLKIVDFSKNSKLKKISKNLFKKCSIENISIPSQITKISKESFRNCENLKTLTISEGSELQSIGAKSFYESSIETLNLPSKVNLDEKWCNFTMNLKNIMIKPNQKQDLIKYEDKFILGKMNKKSDIYDVLVFASRDIEKVVIPSFIKEIAPFAFQGCKKLICIDFEKNSKLRIINRHSFSFTSIKSILIPSSVKTIEHRAFNECKNLKLINFENNSQLNFIDKFAFCNSPIESVSFPPNIIALANNAFYKCYNLLIIEIDENSKMSSFNLDAFEESIDIIMIPFSMKKLLEEV